MLSGKKYWLCLGIAVLALVGLLIGIFHANFASFASGYPLNALDFALSVVYVILTVVLAWLTAQKTGSGIWIAGILLFLSVVIFLIFGLDLHKIITTPVGIALTVVYVVTGFPLYGLTFLFPADPWFFGYNVILFTVLLAEQIGIRNRLRKAVR